MTSTTSSNKGNFDFSAVNAATNNLPAGMKLAIAEGLLISVTKTMNKFSHELEAKATTVLGSLQVLKAEYKVSSIKAQQAKAAAEAENDNSDEDEDDLPQ